MTWWSTARRYGQDKADAHADAYATREARAHLAKKNADSNVARIAQVDLRARRGRGRGADRRRTPSRLAAGRDRGLFHDALDHAVSLRWLTSDGKKIAIGLDVPIMTMRTPPGEMWTMRRRPHWGFRTLALARIRDGQAERQSSMINRMDGARRRNARNARLRRGGVDRANGTISGSSKPLGQQRPAAAMKIATGQRLFSCEL